MYMRVRTVDDAMRDAVREELLNEYSGRGRKDAARIVAEAREGISVEPVQSGVQRGVERPRARHCGAAQAMPSGPRPVSISPVTSKVFKSTTATLFLALTAT
jgi:hypothetical protein